MKRILLSLSLIGSFYAVAQQGFAGISNDNYVLSNSPLFNASSIAGGRSKVALTTCYSLFNQSNYFAKNFSIFNPYTATDGKYAAPNGDPYMFSSLSMEALNFKYEIKNKYAFAYSLRGRMFNVTNAIPGVWAEMAANNYLENTTATPIALDGFRMTHLEYAENAFTYAQILLDKDALFLKAGASFKYLNGLLANDMLFNSGTVTFLNKNDGSADFEDVDADTHSSDNETQQFYNNKGTGFDAGITFEWRPKHKDKYYEMDGKTDLVRHDLNLYKFRLGLSITDIGKINFTRDTAINGFNTALSNQDASGLLVAADLLKNPVNVVQGIQVDGTEKTAGGNTFQVKLPTNFNLQADYHLFKHYYLGYALSLPLGAGSNDARVNYRYAMVLTPRVEKQNMAIMLPISHQGNGKVHLGLAGRVSMNNISIFAGSSNIDILFGKKVTLTRNFFAGITLNLLYKPVSDIDNDKVSDGIDQCPTEAGPFSLKGCPDTDGDGITDRQDWCIYEKGPLQTGGCPDRDNDGIIDMNDQCPDEPGLAVHYGCPDRDFDGVIDAADKCPDIPGIELNNGCPMENPGCCMDDDGDGVTNAVDKCPDHAGSVYNDGCPLDSAILQNPALLSVRQKIDPNHAIEQIKVLSNKDTIRNLIQSKEALDKLMSGKKIIGDHNVYFNSDQYTLTDQEIEALGQFIYKVQAESDLKLMIIGHTDQDGSEDYNLILSKKRAETIQKRLTEAGIPASSMELYYYGESKSLRKNRSLESVKKLERRVEIKVIQE